MCGITCLISKSGNVVDHPPLERANALLRHRGPDDSSVFLHENIGLAHTRLSIVDIAGGKQPFFNEDQSITLICNGEIYNYQALRDQLISRGHSFRSECDCEVIVHLYEEAPESFISQLDGMFSFVLLDRTRSRAVLARDRLGIKPLYVYENAKYLIASSEIKAIFGTGLADRELSPQNLYDFFTFNFIPGSGTCFKDVQSLSPGTSLTIDLRSLAMQTAIFWEPSFPNKHKDRLRDYPQYFEKFREVFHEAIDSHTIGEVPLSSYLSGGMDSSLTTLLLQKRLRDPSQLKAFSIAFTEPQFDESSTFLRTAGLFNLDLSILQMSDIPSQVFSQVIYAIEQPAARPIDVPLFLLAERVRNEGRKVVYSGEGSDELFGGYFTYTLNQLRRTLSMVRSPVLKDILLHRSLRHFIPCKETREQFLRAFRVDSNRVKQIFGTFPAWYPVWLTQDAVKAPLFKEKFPSSLGEGSKLAQICEPLHHGQRNIDDFNKSLYIELKTRLPNYILSRADKNSMAHGVELRVPFLDNHVLDFSLSLPVALKMFGLKEKFIVRSAFRKSIPAHVLKRRKKGFNAPNSWLWERPDSPIPELLSPETTAEVGIFSQDTIQRYRQQIASSQISGPSRELLREALTFVASTHLLHDRFIKNW